MKLGPKNNFIMELTSQSRCHLRSGRWEHFYTHQQKVHVRLTFKSKDPLWSVSVPFPDCGIPVWVQAFTTAHFFFFFNFLHAICTGEGPKRWLCSKILPLPHQKVACIPTELLRKWISRCLVFCITLNLSEQETSAILFLNPAYWWQKGIWNFFFNFYF